MSRSGAYILVIDDEVEIVRALQRSLSAHGYKVFTARSGEEALVLNAQHKPDLLLLDLMLPGMSGLDVLKQLRQKSGVPVLMLTARGSELDRILGLELGADDYLPKPFNPRELVARLRAILRRTAPGGRGADRHPLPLRFLADQAGRIRRLRRHAHRGRLH